MSITTEKLNELEKDYGKWSSWAIWSDENRRDTEVIRDNIDVLDVHYVVVGLNVSKTLTIAWSNFHSGRHDNKLQAAFNNSVVRGAYMTDLIKYNNPNSQNIDTYFAERNNANEIKRQIAYFQKELWDVGAKPETIFILLGRQVQQYFTFFLHQDFFSNRRIFLPHYSARGTDEEWLRVAQGRINGNQ